MIPVIPAFRQPPAWRRALQEALSHAAEDVDNGYLDCRREDDAATCVTLGGVPRCYISGATAAT